MKRAWRSLLAAALVAAALLAGCSSKPPLISRVFARIIYVNDMKTGTRTETLGVFLVASDPDGMENLNAFYVIDDDAELFWKVDHTAWSSTVAEGETWIGASSLVMPAHAPFPSGTYRVVLQSVGGDTVEDTVTVPDRTATPAAAKYPSAVVEGGTIKVGGTSGTSEVWVYGSDGSLAGAFPLQGKAPTLSVAAVRSTSPGLAGRLHVPRVFLGPLGGLRRADGSLPLRRVTGCDPAFSRWTRAPRAPAPSFSTPRDAHSEARKNP